MQTQTRKLSDTEADMLRGMQRGYRQAIEGGLTFLVFAFLGSFFPFLLLQRTVPWFDQHLGLIAAALAACSLHALWRQGHMLPAGPRRALHKDLGQGLVDDLHFEVVEALVIQEQDDEGPGYYLKLIDGRVLFLQIPKIDFLQCPGARQRLAALKRGDWITAWIGRYPTDERPEQIVWALDSAERPIITLDEMHAAHQRHFRKFKLYGGIIPALGTLLILLSLRAAHRAQRQASQTSGRRLQTRAG